MNFSQIPNPSFNDEPWLYNNNNVSELKSSYNNETLQEPVPFEDFKFSFGMNTDFSNTITEPSIMMDPFLQEPFTFMSEPNTVLDENDQKAFSSFLDAFFMDPEMQFNNNQSFYSFHEPKHHEQEKEEHRRTSILQSLDEQKILHQRLSLIASLPTSPTTTATTTGDQCRLRSPSINNTCSSISEDDIPQSIYLRQSDSISSPYTNNNYNRKRSLITHEKPITKKQRTNKELLTEEEKRANHIASEQKRRSTIRNGFKDLTDLIPTLKNINNSKSTVLFKAVDFIKYLEKRTKGLKDKVGSLELRVEVEGRMTNTKSIKQQQQQQHDTIMIMDDEEQEKKEKEKAKKEPMKALPKPIKKPNITSTTTSSNNNQRNTYMNQTSHLQGLPVNARNALLAHKTQQKQLLILQEQLQLHQRLIAQQQEMKERSMISNKNKLPPILGQYESNKNSNSFLLKELEDKSISAP